MVQGIISLIFIFVGCIGNILAIIILHQKELRSAFNQLLMTLCMYDTIFLVSSVVASRDALGYKGQYEHQFCTFMKSKWV